MRKWIYAGLLVSLLVVPNHGRAGGIPVFDGVGLSQEIAGYVQTLMDYAEQLNQLNTLDNQYLVQLQQYQRELEEYQHFLNQIQRLGPVLSEADWNQIFQQSVTYYGNSPWSSIPNINIVTSQGAANLKTVVDTAYEVPASVADTLSQWQVRIPGYGMTERERDEHSADYAQMQKFMDRQRVIATNQQGMDGRSVMIGKLERTAHSLGDDSDLQTQHLIAQQMNFLLQQQELILGELNQLIASQETISEFAASSDLRTKRLQRESQEKHKSNNMPSTLGSDAWKRL